MDYNIKNNTSANRFETKVEGKLGVVEYELSNGRMILLHTEVDPELEGKGIASNLAKHALEFAKDNNLKVVAACRYIKAYINRHPEYQSLE